jgi:LPXTG-motif cell wall-anchored protein
LFFSSRIHRTLPRRFGALVLSGALVASFAGFALANPASAAHVEGVPYEGNLSCAEAETPPVADGEEATWLEFKVEEGNGNANLAYTDGDSTHQGPEGLVIKIENATPQTFDWSSNLDLVAVLVKGGIAGGGLQYSYPGANDGLSDTGLHAPSLVRDAELYYDISHVSFCFVKPVVVVTPPGETETPPGVTPAPEAPAPEAPAAVAPAAEEVQTTVLGETLVAGDTLPRTGAAATNMLVLAGGLGLAFGLMMLMLGRRKTAIHSS